MSNTWVQKIRKNEIIRSQNRKRKAEENRKAKDTLPPPKLEVKLIVERARANKQRYAVVYLAECKLRRLKTLSLGDIKLKSSRKIEIQYQLDGFANWRLYKEKIENCVKKNYNGRKLKDRDRIELTALHHTNKRSE